MSKKEILINFMKNKKFDVGFKTVSENTGLTKKDILILLRKTYKVKKQKKNEDYIIYIQGGYIPQEYDNIRYGDEPQNMKQCIFKAMLHYHNKTISIIEYNNFCSINDYDKYIFNGSNNSFFSIRRDLNYIINDNNLID